MSREGRRYDADPIGDLEPVKTAETRSERRAWRQLADVIADYGSVVRPIEAAARVASEEIAAELLPDEPPRPLLQGRSTEIVNRVIETREAAPVSSADARDPDLERELQRQREIDE